MLSSSLPAPSLSITNPLPAGRVPRWVYIRLIYIILSSIAWAIFGANSNFLPVLREASGRRSLEPRTVAMDVVGRAGETRAVAADDRDEGVVEPPAVGVGC